MKRLIVDETFFSLFPSAQFGVVTAKHIDNGIEATKSKMGRIKSSLAAGCVQTGKYLALENFDENKVVKIWRKAYEKFTADENACAGVITLLKTAHEKGSIESTDALNDICVSDSLIWALPITVLDCDNTAGDIHLGIYNGDLCFYDEQGALSEAWTYRLKKRAAATHETKNAVLIINLIDTTRAMELKACLNTLAKQPASYLGGECASNVLDVSNASCEL